MFNKTSSDLIKILTFLVLVTFVSSFFWKEGTLAYFKITKPEISAKNLASRVETTDSAVSVIVKGKLGEIHNCYNEALENGLDKSGKLVLQWFVDVKGSTSNFTEHLNELDSAELYHCAVKAIENWKFPKYKPTYIRHTFNLKDKPKKAAYIIPGAESVTVE